LVEKFENILYLMIKVIDVDKDVEIELG